MSHSRSSGPVPPAKDVRALFDKANIGNMRYLTFAAEKTYLEKLLGDRLAPLAIRESEYVPEALSLGMTVLDHAPQAAVVKDFTQLVAWLEGHFSSTREGAAERVEIA